MCRSPSCWCAVGIAPFCLTCRDLISGGLCGPSADPVNRENTQKRAAMAGVTGKQDQHLPGGQSSAGRISCLLSYSTCLHCQVKWASCVGRSHSAVLQELLRAEPPSGQPAAMAGEACEQTSTCWEGVAGSALCTAGGSLRAALPVRGMEHLQLLRLSVLLG